MACPNRNMQEYKDLLQAVGSEQIAYLLWDKNGGNPLNQTPTGEESLLYQELLAQTGSPIEALRLKAQYYTDQYLQTNNWIASNIEPSIQQVEQVSLQAPKPINRQALKLSEEDRLNESKTKKTLGVRSSYSYEGMRNFQHKLRIFNDINGTAHSTPNIRNTPLGDFTFDFKFNPNPKVIFKPNEATIPQPKNNRPTSTGQLDLFDISLQAPMEKAATKLNKGTKNEQYLAHKKYMRDQLLFRLSNIKDKQARVQLQERITRLTKDIEAFEKTKNNDIIFDQTDRELKIADILLNKAELDIQDIQQAHALVNHVLKITELWQDTHFIEAIMDEDVSPLPGLTTVTQARFNEIAGTAKTIQTRALKILNNLILNSSNEVLNKKTTLEELTGPTEDIGFASAMTLDVSRTGKALGMALDKWKKIAESRTRDAMDTWIERIQKNLANLTKEQQNLLLQEHEGKKTGKLVFQFSQKYFIDKENMKPISGDTEGWKKYFTWLNKHSITMDARKLFLEDYNELRWSDQKQMTETDREEHIIELKKELGEQLYNEYYEKVKAKHDEFISLRESTMIEAETIAEGLGISTEAYMDEWDQRWSPYRAIEVQKTRRLRTINGQKVKPKGGKFTYTVPRRTVDGKNTGYYDSKYEMIQKDEALKQAHATIMDIMTKMKTYLPYDKTNQMQINSLPAISKTLLEQVTDKDITIMQALTDKYQQMMYDIDPEKAIDKQIDPTTGVMDKRPKIRFINDEMDVNERSFDLPKIMTAFAFMAETFHHKSLVSHNMEMVEEIIGQMRELQTDPTGEVRENSDGYARSTSGQLDNLKQQIDASIEAFYDIAAKPTLSKKKTMTRKDKVKKERLDEEYLKIISQEEAGKISAEKAALEYERITKQQEALGHHYSYTKLGKTMLLWNQLRGMGWNLGAAVANTIFGEITNFTHAASGLDFNSSEYRKASAIVAIPFRSDKNKLSVLMRKYDVIKNFTEEALAGKNPNEPTTWKEKFYPYELQRTTEYQIRAKAFVAMMLHTKVQGKNGEISLWEAYNEDGKWDIEKAGERLDWQGDVENETHNTERRKFEFKVSTVLNRLHGNYDQTTTMAAKKHLMGRMLLQFRSWMPESIATRWEKEKFDDNLERMVKGRYRSFGAYYNAQGGPIKLALGVIYELSRKAVGLKTTFDDKVDNETFTELDAANMRANMQEVFIYLSSIAIALVLKAAFKGDDDDDETKALTTFWLNQISRVQGDMSFYINPQGTERIMKNAIPVATLGSDVIAFTMAVGQALEGDTEIESGYMAGHNRVIQKGAKLIPGATSAYRLWGSTQQIY